MKKYLFIALIAAIISGCGGGGDSDKKNNIDSATGFKLTSNDIQANGSIEQDLTQYGINESPHLTWSNIPNNTKSFVFIMDDISLTPAVVHWNFFTNNTNITEVMRDASGTTAMPTDIIEGSNYLGNNKYDGPYPPSGEKHTYQFCIYALNSKLPSSINSNSSFSNEEFKTQYKNIIIDRSCFKAYYP